LIAKAWNHSRTSSVSKVPIFSRGKSTSKTRNGPHLAHGPPDGLSQRDADILHRVVVVDVAVALRACCDVDERMTSELLEHVIEEADPGGDIVASGAVELDGDGDGRFLRGALDRCASHVQTFAGAGAEVCLISAAGAGRKSKSGRICGIDIRDERAVPAEGLP
jgi:hypothetical protein